MREVQIHPTAVVHPGAKIGDGCRVGPFSVVGAGVSLGPDCELISHTVIQGVTEAGEGCRFFPFCSIGLEPQDLKYRGEPTRVVIGSRNTFREFATVHAGTPGGGGVTTIADRNLFMAYSHVAHDCQLAERVIMANQASLAGHVEIGRCAVIGGMSGVHQFVRIGEYVFLGACSAVLQDIPPYVKAQGNRAKPFGLNVVGLRRHGFSAEAIQALKQAYRILFTSGLNTSQALAQLEQELSGFPEVQRFIDFVKRSQRGISK